MSLLSDASAKPFIREYAQGAAQRATQPVADFIAPTVPVPTLVGRFKRYTEKDRFRIPNTLRGVGGRATELRFEATDGTYNCEPRALDYPVDMTEITETEQVENLLQEGASSVAEVAALDHEKRTIDLATAVLTPTAVNVTFGDSDDPVDIIDNYILQVIKAAKYGSLMGVGVLFGATSFRKFKNNKNVRGKFVSGRVGSASGATLAIPTEADASKLFVGTPDVKTSYMVFDSAPEGLDESIQFVLDSSVMVFARMASPTRRDPSFMKSFRLMNGYMVPGTYLRDDGRAEVAKFDWSEDTQVTNARAGQLINVG